MVTQEELIRQQLGIEDQRRDERDYAGIGFDIVRFAQNRLYMSLPYLDTALAALWPVSGPDRTARIATDGQFLFYSGKWLAAMYEKSGNIINRAFLHTILHCMLRHLYKRRSREDARLWDFSCDVAVESIVTELDYPCLREGFVPAKQLFFSRMKKQMPVITAEGVYRVLKADPLGEEEYAALELRFKADEHHLWVDEDDPENEKKSKKQDDEWRDRSENVSAGMGSVFSADGAEGEGLTEQLRIATRDDVDYRAFLRRFAAPREVMKVDGDAFDYIYYTYGLSLYGNLPLVEPPETKEEKRIEDFVIAVDTSMSTNGDVVKNFLETTYSILRSTDTFTRRCNIHVIQCDDRVRSDEKIEDLEQLRAYMEDFTLKGGSATDFRPVFEHVAGLQASGELAGLRGLIYFTDGLGLYPEKRTPYETAFILSKEPPDSIRIPAWAIRIVLDAEEIFV